MQAETLQLEHTQEQAAVAVPRGFIQGKIRDYNQFVKFRLSSLVIFSAGAGFMIASKGPTDWTKLIWLLTGGFLVTAASCAFNEILEKETDKLMKRTSDRPLPAGRMGMTEALISATLMGSSGLFILFAFVNPICGMLSLASIILYLAVYTPLKKVTPFAVFIGAFPGALPPLLGWVAASGGFTFEGWLLYFIQFIWQFPHFWSIAWVMDEDYKKAGFVMLPSNGEKNKMSAFQAVAYATGLIPLGLLPFYFHMAGIGSAIVLSVCGIAFALQAARLYKTLEDKDARKLMFASFIYLPVILIALYIDKF